MIKLRIELKSESGETLDIFEQMVTGSDNVGMLLDGVRTMINNRLAELDELDEHNEGLPHAGD